LTSFRCPSTRLIELNIQQTIQDWRLQHADLLKTLAAGGEHPLASQVRRFQISGQCGSLGNGEPVFVVRLGMCDLRALMNQYSIDQVAEFLLFEKERIWRECDKQTRIVGKLVKCVTVIDFAGFSMFGNKSDNRFFKALGKSSKLSSLYYPQLQIKTVSINTPSYYSMVHKVRTDSFIGLSSRNISFILFWLFCFV
jgi:hypothetical protein